MAEASSSKGFQGTPGPWHVHYKANHKDGADLPWIAGHMGRPLAFITYETILKEDLARAEANARLIAAAPEMAKALKQIAAHPQAGLANPGYESCRDIANTALSTALGEDR